MQLQKSDTYYKNTQVVKSVCPQKAKRGSQLSQEMVVMVGYDNLVPATS